MTSKLPEVPLYLFLASPRTLSSRSSKRSLHKSVPSLPLIGRGTRDGVRNIKQTKKLGLPSISVFVCTADSDEYAFRMSVAGGGSLRLDDLHCRLTI